jgi:hypothetical protein
MICASLLRECSSRRKLRLNGMKLRAGSASSRVWRETALVIFLSDRGFAGEAGMSLGEREPAFRIVDDVEREASRGLKGNIG